MAIHTTRTGLADAALLGEYWDSELLDNLWPELQYYQFAEKKRIPGGVGKTIHFTRFERLRDQAGAPADGLQALSELADSVLEPSYISATEVSATVVQYGHGVLFSDFMLLTARFDLVNESLEQLGMDAGLWVDSYTVNNAIRGNGYGVIAGWQGVTSARQSITSATQLTIDDIYWASTKASETQMKRFKTGTRVGIGAPAQLHNVKNATSVTNMNSWMELNKYTGDGQRKLMGWSLGNVAGIDIFEAHNGASVTSTYINSALSASAANRPAGLSAGVNSYVFRVITPGAYGALDIEGGAVSTFVKKLGSAGWRDLINQRAGVGIKLFYGVKDLAMATRALEIYSGKNPIFGL